MLMCEWAPPKPMTPDAREALCEWLSAHGIDPSTVEDGCLVVVHVKGKRELHVTEYVTDEDGRRVIDYAACRAVTRPRSVPLMVEPPIPSGPTP